MKLTQPFVYADYHATTPVDPRVAALVYRAMTERVGNASSADHLAGDLAEASVQEAREHVAALVGGHADDVIFTAGATESINLALQGFVRRAARKGRVPHVAVSNVEHRAVLETARALARDGLIRLSYVPVDRQARIDVEAVAAVAREGLDLLAVMAANNEVGTLYPTRELGEITASVGAAFLCDASQAVGKMPVSTQAARITFLACSAHKIYGPQGVGALVIEPGQRIEPLLHGGGQQRSVRPGTYNVAGIIGLGEAARLRALEWSEDESRVGDLRDTLERDLRERIDGLTINGAREARLAGNLHVSIQGVPNDMVVSRIRDRVALATGAACTSGLEEPSHVLRAMDLSLASQESALRIGLGKFTTLEEIAFIGDVLTEAVASVRRAVGH